MERSDIWTRCGVISSSVADVREDSYANQSHYRYLADTPFEDGTFRLLLHFEEAYPNKPPQVKFVSKMFHPNVYANGELCLDILQNRWSPTYDVVAILTSVQSLLNDPNPNRWVLN